MVVERGKVQTTREGFRKRLEGVTPMRIALEVGTHSSWVSRLLKELGHEVLVANPRKTRLIYENRGKQHRPESVAQDLAVLRARNALVRTRTLLVNHVRRAVKATGYRVKKCSTRTFSDQAVDQIPPEVLEALSSVLTTIEVVSTQILTLEDPGRFRKSRAVGPYLGLVPARSQSGDSDSQLRITKEGDSLLRRLLVQSAQYILGPFGEDCDLRRFGQALSVRGERNAKKRAVVAVARKLAVLLHRLWRTVTEDHCPLLTTTGLLMEVRCNELLDALKGPPLVFRRSRVPARAQLGRDWRAGSDGPVARAIGCERTTRAIAGEDEIGSVSREDVLALDQGRDADPGGQRALEDACDSKRGYALLFGVVEAEVRYRADKDELRPRKRLGDRRLSLARAIASDLGATEKCEDDGR
jgi:transposase